MSTRPLLLDLFCGAGGCAVGYHRAGFDVIGVDIKPQPRYPFHFIEEDAVDFLMALVAGSSLSTRGFILSQFSAIHASPPCQAYSAMGEMPNARDHPELVEPVRELLKAANLPWVIENVVGAPVESDDVPLFGQQGVMLCGSMFSLSNGTHELRRHRLFETSFRLPQPACNHALPVIGFYGDHARTRQRTVAGNKDRGKDITGNDRKLSLVRELMGINWMKWHEAVLAIPPAYTEFVGKHLMGMT